MKLYRITLKGMISSYGTSYVVAKDPTEGYRIVREFLDNKNLGFTKDREMDKIELLADYNQYGDGGSKLHLSISPCLHKECHLTRDRDGGTYCNACDTVLS